MSSGDFHPAVRAAIARRSGGRCEVQAPGCWGQATMCHHILRRGHHIHTVDNALHVCAACHTYIHSVGAEAYAKGWLRKSSIDAR